MLTRRNIFQASLAGMFGFFSSKAVAVDAPILLRRKIFLRGLLKAEGSSFIYNGKGGFQFCSALQAGLN